MSIPVNSLYSLTWGDYGTSLVSAVQLLRCHGDLVDVTLAAEGRSFEAHKIVLCAASPYLLNLLKNTSCKHPIVMLAGVSANDLEALLEFVYRGEVSVDHSQLPSLLQAAQCLNIQGLAPQTVTHKDDTTAYTSIQIHPGLVHQDVKTHILEVGGNIGEQELIMQQAPQTVQTHHQVVEEILPEQMSDEVTKEVINQFLPQRKRKPRTPKTPGKPSKVIKMEPQTSGSETLQTVTATAVEQGTEMIVEEQEQVAELVEQVSIEEQSIDQNTSNVSVKTEGGMPKTPKDKSNKPKSKSQSEQPATCPICSATIRQSRNLRRHLELRHFKKRTPKKLKKGMAADPNAGNTSTEQIIQDGGNNTITVTMEPGSDQQTITVNGQQAGQQHVLTTNSDGSLSISGLQGHIIGSLGNATIIRTDDGQQIESGQLITTHEPSLRTSTGEVYRVGTTVYHIEERRSDQPRMN